MPVEKASKEELEIWDKILTGWDLGMARGIGQLNYRQIYDQEKATDYVRTHRTNGQHLNHLNSTQWKDPEFRAKRSKEVSEQMKKKWKENPSWRHRTIMGNFCGHPERPHHAKGKCTKCYANARYQEKKNSRPVAPRLK